MPLDIATIIGRLQRLESEIIATKKAIQELPAATNKVAIETIARQFSSQAIPSSLGNHVYDKDNPHDTSDANLDVSDITTNNVTISAHGFCPKSDNDVTKFLQADNPPDWAVPDHGSLGGLTDDDHSQYVLANGTRDINYNSGDFQIGDVTGGNYAQFELDGTIELVGNATVWDDLRITAGGFDFPGVADPTLIPYDIAGGGTNVYLYEFAKNDFVTVVAQIPHGYKEASDIKVHIHWTPGPNGVGESGNLVGWKVLYSWANIDGAFGALTTADLSDACAGTNHLHQMTPEVTISGTLKTISSMLVCNVTRTDTGADDTWAGSGTGNLPIFLEIDFHFEIDTIGSRAATTK